jgi:hypothetical protein
MATPHVTGAVALYTSHHMALKHQQQRSDNPAALLDVDYPKGVQIKAALMSSVDRRSNLDCISGGYLNIGSMLDTQPGAP